MTAEAERGEGALAGLPPDAGVLALVGCGAHLRWAASAALDFAEVVGGQRPRTVLLNLETGDSGLDDLFDASRDDGLTRVLAGEASLSTVARRRPGASFLYVPAGRPALPWRRLAGSGALGALVRRIRETGGTALLYLAEESLSTGVEEELETDGCVSIGPVDPRRLAGLGPVRARVARPEPAAAEVGEAVGVPRPPEPTAAAKPAGAGWGGRGSGFPAEAPPARTSRAALPLPDVLPRGTTGSRPVPKSILGRLVERIRRLRWSRIEPYVWIWGGSLVVVWFGWQALSGWPAFQEEQVRPPTALQAAGTGSATETPPAGDEGATAGAEAGGSGDGDGGPGPGAGSAAGEPAGAERGEALAYSVLVASFARRSDAEKALAALERGGRVDAVSFLSPTRVRGRTYWRLFAGALADGIAAEAYLEELVRAGVKEERRTWDARPVRLAFLLGRGGTRTEAESVAGRLRRAGIPAYLLRDGGAWAVYAGAYETEAAAAPLDSLLSVADVEAELVTRRGEVGQ